MESRGSREAKFASFSRSSLFKCTFDAFSFSMALSRVQRVGLQPAEIEFMATEEEIDIIPLFSLDSLFNLDKVSSPSTDTLRDSY